MGYEEFQQALMEGDVDKSVSEGVKAYKEQKAQTKTEPVDSAKAQFETGADSAGDSPTVGSMLMAALLGQVIDLDQYAEIQSGIASEFGASSGSESSDGDGADSEDFADEQVE